MQTEPSPSWQAVREPAPYHKGVRYRAYVFLAEVYEIGPNVFRWHVEAGVMANPTGRDDGYRAEGTAPSEREGQLCAEAVAKALGIWTRAR